MLSACYYLPCAVIAQRVRNYCQCLLIAASESCCVPLANFEVHATRAHHRGPELKLQCCCLAQLRYRRWQAGTAILVLVHQQPCPSHPGIWLESKVRGAICKEGRGADLDLQRVSRPGMEGSPRVYSSGLIARFKGLPASVVWLPPLVRQFFKIL